MAAPGLHRDWLGLVRLLDAWAHSAEPCGDDIAVTLEPGRVVHVVVTPDDLDMLRIAFGALPHVAQHVTDRLGAMPDDHDFLVHTQYDLEPATTRDLPPRSEVPPPEAGHWVAYEPPAGGTP